VIAVVFDTETTGLIQNHSIKIDNQAEVIEFYAAKVNLKTGKVMKELDTLIKPSRLLSDKPELGSKKTITQITGITNAMLSDAKPFADHADEIEKILKSAEFVIAHNVSFDKEMIDIELERLKRKIKWPRAICTVEATAHIKGGRMSLTKLHEYLFGEGFDAHRAKSDVVALIRCACELYKREMI
jgi:DNA polymerase III subunit epsilon